MARADGSSELSRTALPVGTRHLTWANRLSPRSAATGDVPAAAIGSLSAQDRRCPVVGGVRVLRLALVIATLWMLIESSTALYRFSTGCAVQDSQGNGGLLLIIGTAVLAIGVILVGGTVSVLTGFYLSGMRRSILRGAYEVLCSVDRAQLRRLLALVVYFDWGFRWRPGCWCR